MNIIGVKLAKPEGADIAVAATWAVIAGLIGAFILLPLIGGNWKHIAGMAMSAAIAGLAASCGASYKEAGFRGLLICVMIGAIGFSLVISL